MKNDHIAQLLDQLLRTGSPNSLRDQARFELLAIDVDANLRIAEAVERLEKGVGRYFGQEAVGDELDINQEWQIFRHELIWGSVWEYKGVRYIVYILDETEVAQFQDGWFPVVKYKLHESEGDPESRKLSFSRTVVEFVHKFKRVR